MIAVQIACAAVLATTVGASLARARPRGAFLRRLALVAAASWIAEDTCIRAYEFYAYADGWWPFVDRVPLLVALIWPAVILSAVEVARHLAPARPGRGPWIAAALVLADAALIEPIAVRSGLWSWRAPGLFSVPLIGLLGWAFFAGACAAVFRAVESRRLPPLAEALVIPLAPAATHALLLASWWGGLRHLDGPVPPLAGVVVAWAAALALTAAALARRAGPAVPPGALWTRAPGAAFFFVLLALNARDDPLLVAYALAFAPPYLALLRRSPLPDRVPSARGHRA